MDRLCQNCGATLAPTKRSHAVFCDVKCKKQAEHKRRIADPEKREKNRQRSKRWRESNPEKAKEKVSLWISNNPEKVARVKARYRNNKIRSTPIWLTPEQLKSMESLYALCRRFEQLMPARYHVDHIVPLNGRNVCGLNVPWNLQVLEATSNIRKRNKFETDWENF